MGISFGKAEQPTDAIGDVYQPVWRNFGGTGHASFGTNVSNQTLFANKSTYDNKVTPYEISGVMRSEIDVDAYNYWANAKDVVWFKSVRAYTTSGLYNDNQIYSDVYLTYREEATFEKSMQSVGGGYTDLGGPVSMIFYLGTGRTFYDWGSTRYSYSTSVSNIGFANNTDSSVPSGQSVMGNGQSIYSSAGWEARHVISYVHNSANRDTTRCQFRCWGDISGVVLETCWHARHL
jgi:hypothetical protein